MANYRCNSRCGCDFSTRTVLKPDLTATGTVFAIFVDAFGKSLKRRNQLLEGSISPEEYEGYRDVMTDWLLRTFSGENEHFRTSEGWNPEGLGAYLEEVFSDTVALERGTVLKGPEATLAMAVTLLVNDIEKALDEFNDENHEALNAAVHNRLMWWSRLFTGAPVEMLAGSFTWRGVK